MQDERDRSKAVVETLLAVETACHKAGFLEGLNPFGKAGVRKRQEILKDVKSEMERIAVLPPSEAVKEVEKHCYFPPSADKNLRKSRAAERAVRRFANVPAPLASGLSRITGPTGPIPLPHFMLRGSLHKHVTSVIASDDFLALKGAGAVESLGAASVLELCRERGILNVGSSLPALRERLRAWVEDAER